MPVTQQDLDSFHQFASERIANSVVPLSFDDLIVEWLSHRDRDDINAAIEEGLADVEAGRHRPARHVTEELRQKYGLPTE